MKSVKITKALNLQKEVKSLIVSTKMIQTSALLIMLKIPSYGKENDKLDFMPADLHIKKGFRDRLWPQSAVKE